MVFKPYLELLTIGDNAQFMERIENIKNVNIAQFNDKYGSINLFMNNFVPQLDRIARLSYQDRDDFKDFLDLINENISVMLSVFTDIKEFIKEEGKVYPSEVYSADIVSLAGGCDNYQKKYLEMKVKYFALRDKFMF